jgi:hypothetical protein
MKSKQSQTNRTPRAPHTLTPEQAVAALNEHGFLLQQAVRKKIEGYETSAGFGVHWRLAAYEYPVQAPDGSETTIDLLLRNASTCLCLECKRPNAGYKHWLFLESSPIPDTVANETYIEACSSDGDRCKRKIDRLPPSQVASFYHFLEVTLSQPDTDGEVKKRNEPLARTDSLHAALRQAITATTGLTTKLIASHVTARAVPVIVTTAQLYECRYPVEKIDSVTGTIATAEIQLKQHPFVAVQYSAPESLALKELTAHERAPGINDLVNSLLRTVYIVRVHGINDFLYWAGHNLR